MLSPQLEVSINLAVSEAARRRHEYVTVEHLTYALLHNDSVKPSQHSRSRHRQSSR